MRILKLKGDRNVQISENVWTGDEKKAMEEKGMTDGFALISQVVSDTHMLDKITAQKTDANSEVEVEVEAEGENVSGLRSTSVSTPSLFQNSKYPLDGTTRPRDGLYAKASATVTSDGHADSSARIFVESDIRGDIAMDVASADDGLITPIPTDDFSISTGLLGMFKADKDICQMDVSNELSHAANSKNRGAGDQMEIELSSGSMPLNDINSLQIKSGDDIECTSVKDASLEMEAAMSTSKVGDVTDINNHISDDHYYKAVARISFLGWGEHYDAWIDVDSPLLAKLNSQSGCRRGDGPVSEEIIFMVGARARTVAVAAKELNLESGSGSGDNGNVIACRFSTTGTEEDGCFHSTDLADVVNVFGDNQGFDILLALINTAADLRWKSSISISLPFMLGVITAVWTLNPAWISNLLLLLS